MKPILDYVFSAPNMLQLTFATNELNDTDKQVFKDFVFPQIIKNIKSAVNLNNFDNKLSLLFNAFIEENVFKLAQQYNNYGVDSIYGDSGGLQIVTLGKKITPELKKQVYRTQMASDFAMCFDEIPLTSMYSGIGTAERVNVANKLYMTSRQTECGTLTGLNIKEQVRTFQDAGSKTKAFCILQGNTPEDMVKFYEDCRRQLTNEDLEGLGGIAVADTCMGNETLESVDLMTGWKMVYESELRSYREHLHLLGIGSVSRMTPVLALMKSGYIPEGTRISFDSSSHSQAYIFGRFYDESGKMRQLDRTDTPNNREFFTQIYKFYENIFSRWISEKEYVEHFSKYAGSIGKTRQEAKSYNLRLIAGINIYAACLWQYVNFMNAIDREVDVVAKKKNPVNMLREVKNLDDMKHWNKMCRSYLPSNRILREDERVTLDIFA